jgi:hypothetical protein
MPKNLFTATCARCGSENLSLADRYICNDCGNDHVRFDPYNPEPCSDLGEERPTTEWYEGMIKQQDQKINYMEKIIKLLLEELYA